MTRGSRNRIAQTIARAVSSSCFVMNCHSQRFDSHMQSRRASPQREIPPIIASIVHCTNDAREHSLREPIMLVSRNLRERHMQCLAQHDSRDIATNRTRPRISRRKLSLLKQVTRIHRKQLCDVAHYECTRRRSLTAICPQFSQNRQHLHANLRASEREIMIRRITRPFPVGRAANQLANRSRLHQ